MPAKGIPTSTSLDVAVVGGGIVGLAVAHELGRRGRRAVVLERAEPAAATTHVAAGMLAPTAEAAFGEEALLEANLRSARLHPAWAASLGVTLHDRGTLIVARDRDEAEALERERAYREELGLEVERLLPSRARQLEPALAPTIRLALHLPEDYAVDPRAIAAALAARVDVRRAEVVRVEPGALALADGTTLAARAIVLAAGPWSAGLGDVPVRPVKGQSLRLRDPAGPGAVERVLRSFPEYLVPRGDGRYVLGATQEERGWDTTVTAGGLHDLLRRAVELVPGVAEWVVEEAIAGLRPMTPDNAPVVGPAAIPGAFWATGHGRHGVLLAPLTAELVADLVCGGSPDLGPFDPARLAGAALP